jgi:feruloyl esterase
MNAGEILKQWTNVHGLESAPTYSETVDGYPRRVWTDAAGEEVIEEFVITGMAHGTPLATGDAEHSYGAAGPFLLDVGISSSYQIAKFWGLTETSDEAWHSAAHEPVQDRSETVVSNSRSAPEVWMPEAAARNSRQDRQKSDTSHLDVGSVITKALRAAGLMK